MIIPYASQTSGTNRRLIEAAGWRQFVSPDTYKCNGDPTTAFALDNGAWGAFKNGYPWPRARFRRVAHILGHRADFIVIPDVVEDARATLAMADEWLLLLAGYPLYLAIQDGMEWSTVRPFVPRIRGLFIGGSTEWKERSMVYWGRCAREAGLAMHVGRVNTVRRIRMCVDAGADSFDGSSVSIYGRANMPKLDREVRQQWLPGWSEHEHSHEPGRRKRRRDETST